MFARDVWLCEFLMAPPRSANIKCARMNRAEINDCSDVVGYLFCELFRRATYLF